MTVALRDRVVLTEVSKTYDTPTGSTVALSPTDLVIEPGEFVSVVGPSGCGKTTLLQLLGGFLPPSSGSLLVGQDHIDGPGPERGVVFQTPTLYPWLSVRGNIEFGPKCRGVDRKTRRAAAERMLALVGLVEFGGKRPYELSGGMQQRAQIARVLVNDPRIILMDEPFGALDQLTRERLQVELLRVWREAGKTIVFVTHSVEEAVFLSTRVLVMSARPGRRILDRRIRLPDDDDAGVRELAVTATPEFQALKTELAKAIYEAHS
ncbi:ABC transporter ATP-binding protein [Nocardia seriolae]|uniref:ABC transporter ATP-binding protein n=1 Tax=Nocardia seriolae TaxID=37332 RepID=UPI00051A232D|nr:ABC transporter ATP-binding protein [Nocardia seriolae]MTJ63507.1 ATP-binding cassette domain-containing protein [Nocardia seriolae]MTJ73990.1 ATP-binding cassette domain-containing protein [Nocardia seriolae]MTJ88532.1 ATP-binding cassette domain-containing protein [Nocardia seriolae]MTK32516.1 ATP-binding cassette domain-containing protein [Nocardia seriolae]MTK41406.1 ATP-binding cassette domain-containing protein [Nocardia seriolae]